MDVHPLIFEPILKPRLWGGRRLHSALGKRLPADSAVGESWELVDLGGDVSIAARGPAGGQSIRQLIERWGSALTGRASLPDGRFPLLLKFLDAAQTLSIQVHPGPDQAAESSGDAPFKHEAWYVIDAAPTGCIYRGLRPGGTMEDLRRALQEQQIEAVLNRIAVKPGQAFYLPAGTVHALGAGVLVAEVQTPSDVTYRLYDWGRVDPSTGRQRALHVAEALRCVRTDVDFARAEERSHVASVWTAVTRLVTCESFIIERIRMIDGIEQEIPYSEMVMWMVLSGSGEIGCRFGGSRLTIPFARGDTVLLPAGLKEGRVRTQSECSWLEVTVPVRSDLAEFERPTQEALRGVAAPSSAYVNLNLARPDQRSPSS